MSRTFSTNSGSLDSLKSRRGAAAARTPARSARPPSGSALSRPPSAASTNASRHPAARLQRLDDHLLDLLVGDLARPPRPRLIHQPIEATLDEPPAPLAHRLRRHPLAPRSPVADPPPHANTIRDRNASACALDGPPRPAQPLALGRADTTNSPSDVQSCHHPTYHHFRRTITQDTSPIGRLLPQAGGASTSASFSSIRCSPSLTRSAWKPKGPPCLRAALRGLLSSRVEASPRISDGFLWRGLRGYERGWPRQVPRGSPAPPARPWP